MEELIKFQSHGLKGLSKGNLVGCKLADGFFEGKGRVGHGVGINESTKMIGGEIEDWFRGFQHLQKSR